DLQGHATTLLLITGAGAVICGVAAFMLASNAVRWSLLLPLIPAAVLSIAIVIEHEKRALGEVAVALTCSLAAGPVCLAAGGALPSASVSRLLRSSSARPSRCAS